MKHAQPQMLKSKVQNRNKTLTQSQNKNVQA